MLTVSQRIRALQHGEITTSLTRKLSISRAIDGGRWYMQGGGTDGTYAYYISEPIVKNDAQGVAPLVMCYMEVKRLTSQE